MMKRQPTNHEYVLGGLFALMATFPASDPLSMATTLIPGCRDENSKTAPHDQASRYTKPRGGYEAAADLSGEHPDLADSLPWLCS